jgi:hypothetical protein
VDDGNGGNADGDDAEVEVVYKQCPMTRSNPR